MFNRTKQHGWTQPESAIRKHFDQCQPWRDIVGMFQTDEFEVDKMNFQTSCVRDNTEVIGRSDNWLKLAFLESLAIKEEKPELNRGLKSCKELALF